MKTEHTVVIGDARELAEIETDSIELVVTSPPYPMIEMWDDQFGRLNEEIVDHLAADDGRAAFELMHDELDAVWEEVSRVLIEGGIACINVGDATRSIDGRFRVYQNHARIIESFESLGFEPLPDVLWRKPVNSSTKFMGSGMLPPNAYVTLEHEYILVFRNGTRSRSFAPGAEHRYRSAYFWEERNRWFSDLWTDLRGEHQALHPEASRDRSGAYPFELPYRLIAMYSVYGDNVCDPFWGTGTTSLAAMVAGRNSVGYELDESVPRDFGERVSGVETLSKRVARSRIEAHTRFVSEAKAAGEEFLHESDHYSFPVTTRQEQAIKFFRVASVDETEGGFLATHAPVEWDATDQSALYTLEEDRS